MAVELGNLNSKTKPQLIELIKALATENAVLKKFNNFIEATEKRLIDLERNQYKNQQYSRRDSIEISGIPQTIQQNDLEAEVIKIYEAAEVNVHGEKLEAMSSCR